MRLILAITAASLLAACGGASATPATPTPTPDDMTVNGTFTLMIQRDFQSKTSPAVGDACQGSGGYSDIREGMEVRLEADGTILDVARLGRGRFSAVDNWAFLECRFTFSLDVPDGHEFYTVIVGRRGERSYTFAEITARNALAYSIGGD